MQNCNHRAFHQPYMHVVIAFILFITLSVSLPAYSMCWPILGCNISCCRLFRRQVRCHRSLSFTHLCRWSLMDSLYLPSLPLLSFLDGLKPYYCIKISFETFDVLSVWLLLCYKSFKYCACQHYRSRDDTDAQTLDGVRSGRYTDAMDDETHVLQSKS